MESSDHTVELLVTLRLYLQSNSRHLDKLNCAKQSSWIDFKNS